MSLRDRYWSLVSKDIISDDLLVLGNITEISEKELADADIRHFIHMGQVLAIDAATPMHEECVAALSAAIGKATGLYSMLQRPWPVMNDLGCHSTTNKQPDASFRPTPHGPDLRPSVVVEVSVRHEPFWLLLMEGRAWINAPGVEYVVLAKIFPDTKRRHTRIMVLQRTSKPLEAELPPCSGTEERRRLSRVSSMGTEKISRLFGLRIIFDADVWAGAPLPNLVAQLELRRLCRDPKLSGSVSISWADMVRYVLEAPEGDYRVLPQAGKPKPGGSSRGTRSFSTLARASFFPAPPQCKLFTCLGGAQGTTDTTSRALRLPVPPHPSPSAVGLPSPCTVRATARIASGVIRFLRFL